MTTLRVRALDSSPARLRRDPGLAIPPLGLALVVLGGLAWLTGLVYLAVRAGLPSLVAPAVVDGVHIYAGVAALVFLGAKVWRVGFRRDVVGIHRPELWQRWLSWSMVGLYAAVFLTGGLALLPAQPDIRTKLVNAHLISSVWAAVPTTWHVLHYRQLAAPYLRPLRRLQARRLWLALALVPVAVAGVVPRAAGQLSALGAGAAWQDDGPQVFLDRMEVMPDGRTAVAGGRGLFAGDLATGTWRRLRSLPATDDVLGLALPRGGPVAVYVGTSSGLDAAASLDGPYRRLSLPAREIHGIAVDPADPRTVWASSWGGMWRSDDAGTHWRPENAGIGNPVSVWPVAYRGPDLFVGDVDGIYRWDGQQWEWSTAFPYVASFTTAPDGRLFAASMGAGLRVYDGGAWQDASAGLTPHGHGGAPAIHAVTVTALADGTAYLGTMLDGVAVSRDGGRSWTPVWTGLAGRGDVWRIVRYGDQLVAATDSGIATYRLPSTTPPGWAWWSALTLATVAAALAAVLLAAWRRDRPRQALLLGQAAQQPVALGQRDRP